MKGLHRGEQLENDYIPEAYVFDRPPSLGGSVTDILGCVQSTAEIRNRQLGLSYFIIW